MLTFPGIEDLSLTMQMTGNNLPLHRKIIKHLIMGKGDKRTKRGKIVLGTYGKTRLKKNNKPAAQTNKKEDK